MQHAFTLHVYREKNNHATTELQPSLHLIIAELGNSKVMLLSQTGCLQYRYLQSRRFSKVFALDNLDYQKLNFHSYLIFQ